MRLLQEIQMAATDGTTDLETLLRKCTILAFRLKHDDFKNWVQRELDGYPNNIEVPEYRIIDCQSFGQFFNGFQELTNAPIPKSLIPPEIRDQMTRLKMIQGVGSLQSIVDTTENGAIRFAWPADANIRFGDRIYKGMILGQAWWMISKDIFVGILSTVRNRVLNFALEIEASYPNAGEASPDSTPVPKEMVSQIFHTHIYGSVGNVAAGHDIQQTAIMNIQKGNFQSLAVFLQEQGIKNADIAKLKNAIQEDPEPSNDTFGKKVSKWIGTMTQKAAAGLWKVGSNVASAILTKAITAYYYGD